jgi:NAD(P)-dependent dehydrogenase (short-subunit alcohol dehydrogenase family)
LGPTKLSNADGLLSTDTAPPRPRRTGDRLGNIGRQGGHRRRWRAGSGPLTAGAAGDRGADIVTFDIREQIDAVACPPRTEQELAQTVEQVDALGRRVVAIKADVCEEVATDKVFDEGLAEFGRVDTVIANAGIMPVLGPTSTVVQAWHDCVDVTLTGVLYTVEAAIPTPVEQDQGGAIALIGSAAGLKGTTRSLRSKTYGMLGYTAAKHGVVGLTRSYANALGGYDIRVNSIHPTGVDTPMVNNDAFLGAAPEVPEFFEAMTNILSGTADRGTGHLRRGRLAGSDQARYLTGAVIPVDAGATAR